MARFIDRVRMTVVAALAAVAVAGCGRAGHGDALERIGALVEEDAAAAAAALDSLDRGVMDEAQGNYYDFLKLKADDKRYEPHKSDSTIARLLDYYRGTALEAEVTYYAGWVYSDMGDYPTALRYFQDALELTKGDKERTNLRRRVTSQTGRLLNDLRLYREAIPYLEETIEIGYALKSKDLPFDNQLLGAVYMHLQEYEQAEGYFRKALSQAANEGDSALFQGYLAASKFQRGDNREALKLIREVPERSDPLDKDFLLSYAADIYINAGIRDTAYMYALELSRSSDPKFNRSGYEILLRPELHGYSTMDSIESYAKQFTNSMNEVFNEHGAQAVIMQNTMYNYALHEREKERIATEKLSLQRWLLTAGIVVAIVVCAAGWYKYRLAVKKVQLAKSENLLLILEREHKETLTELSRLKEGASIKDLLGRLVEQSRGCPDEEENGVAESVREEIMSKIASIKRSSGEKTASYMIKRSSSTGRKIIEAAVARDEPIKDDSEIWEKIENCVAEESENFTSKLLILSGGSISKDEYRLALLIKCGATPKDLTVLLGRGKSAVSTRRKHLSTVLFQKDGNINTLDHIIRLL